MHYAYAYVVPGIPRAFDCASLRWKGGEFEPDLSLVSPLLVNNSLKRVFNRRLKVSLRHIFQYLSLKGM